MRACVGLPRRQRCGKAREKSAEAIVVPRVGMKGRIFCCGEAVGRIVEWQQGTAYQLSLLEWRKETVHHGQDSRWPGLLSSDASVLMRTKATS